MEQIEQVASPEASAEYEESQPPQIKTPLPYSRRVRHTAEAIRDTFAQYHWAFKAITRHAKERFEECDWHGLHADASERLDLYRDFVSRIVKALKADLADLGRDLTFWAAVKKEYTALIVSRNDADLAQSFYNSVTMRVIGERAIDPEAQYLGSEIKPASSETEEHVYKVYQRGGSTQELVRQMLVDCAFSCGYEDLERDSALAAAEIESYLHCNCDGEPIKTIELVQSVFYRGKAAYLVGRISTGSHYVPLVVALVNSERGVTIDAVLLTEDEVSIVFSFTRAYFHVDIDNPRALVRFLRSIMPLKPVPELYISLGHNKHGKTELYRDLTRHLAHSDDTFEIARGERGMVMVVFTLPTYDVVFKIIKDTFDYPKRTTRQEVRNRYYLVFKHDRGGRLVDAQEFEHLRFPRSRFSPALLDELLNVAAHTVRIDGDEVVIDHLYTERRLTPLNLYIIDAPEEAATDAVIDYGQAIKDLAATNIFPGDILLKNFGVTRHGRIVFYDYDELCLLTDCVFREMPQAEDVEEDLFAEPWFSVGEQDVFPEEMETFLGLPGHLKEVFVEHHRELFGVEFWADMQRRHLAGEVMEIFPYPERKRLRHD